MKKYNFDEAISRNNTLSVKWDMTKEVFGSADLLPMWVADMDFRPPSEVIEALKERIDHGIFGYTYSGESTADSIKQWLERRHGWSIESSWVLYNSGVVPSIAAAIEAYTDPGDKVLLQSPVYAPFFEKIKSNNREVVNSPLILKDNRYEIDFADFEEKLKSGVKLFLLCNPHNPGGRVWTKEELLQLGELCLKYNCLILSDEIHSDLIFKPNKHVPLVSLDERFKDMVITCIAPTKTFNLAGLHASAVIIANEDMRKKFASVLGRQGFFTLPALGIIGMEAAYRHGDDWLEELLEYLKENAEIAKTYIAENIPNISVMEPDGTYLLWINCRGLGKSDTEIKELLVEKGKLGLEPGTKYGPGGEGFVRMNLGCTKETLKDGLDRLKKAFE